MRADALEQHRDEQSADDHQDGTPLPHWYRGIAAVTDFAVRVPMTACGSWRHRPVTANGQAAVASYSRTGDEGPYHCWSINLLTLRDDRIAEITSFLGPHHFEAFGLPASLP